MITLKNDRFTLHTNVWKIFKGFSLGISFNLVKRQGLYRLWIDFCFLFWNFSLHLVIFRRV